MLLNGTEQKKGVVRHRKSEAAAAAAAANRIGALGGGGTREGQAERERKVFKVRDASYRT